MARSAGRVTGPSPAWPPARGVLLVGAVWLLGQALLWVTVGPRLGGDSERYLAQAAAWLGGVWPVSGQALLFSTYSLYVAGCLGLGLGTAGVVLGQIALSGAAAWWLYRRGKKLGGRLTKLPWGDGWTRFRDFPAPQGKTFQSQWRGARRHRKEAA